MARRVCCDEELDVMLVLQAISYGYLLILLTIITISAGTLFAHFNGECILVSQLTWGSAVDHNLTTTQYPAPHQIVLSLTSTPSACQFIIYASAIAIFYLCIALGYHLLMLHRSRQDSKAPDNLIVRPMIVFNCLYGIFSLIHASIVSAGYYSFCSTQISNGHLNTCEDLEKDQYWHISSETVKPHGAITDIQIAQVCLWLSFIGWTIILALSIIRHLRNQRIRSSERFAVDLVESAGTELTTGGTGGGDDREETVLFSGYSSLKQST